MATPPRTDEACTRCAQIWLSSDENFTEGALSAGMDRMTFKRHVEEAFARGLIVKDGVLPGFSIRSISTQYDAGGNEKGKSVRQAPAPDGQFAVPDGHRITGVSSYLDANGNVAAQWVKTRSEPDPAEVAKVVAEAVAALMVGLKLARLAASPRKLDTWVDMAGYAVCGVEVASGGEPVTAPVDRVDV